MYAEDYRAFTVGKLTEKRALESLFTDLGSSFYAYMVMLNVADRKEEGRIYEELRKKIFTLRDTIFEGKFGEDELRELDRIAVEINTIYRQLQVTRSPEATILQTPANNALGLWAIMKDHLKKVSE